MEAETHKRTWWWQWFSDSSWGCGCLWWLSEWGSGYRGISTSDNPERFLQKTALVGNVLTSTMDPRFSFSSQVNVMWNTGGLTCSEMWQSRSASVIRQSNCKRAMHSNSGMRMEEILRVTDSVIISVTITLRWKTTVSFLWFEKTRVSVPVENFKLHQI
jgi:hypothetical protein